MTAVWQIEALALYLPILLSGFLIIWLKPHRRIRIALVMTCGWQAATLPWLNLWAQNLGYWRFQTEKSSLFGIPLSLYFGWVILWGLIAPLIAGRLPIRHPMIVTCLAAIALDLATMPLLKPVLVLGPAWLIGECALVLFALIPSLIIAHFTFLDRKPKLRSFLISISFTLLTLGVLPFVNVADFPTLLGQLHDAYSPTVHFSTLALVILLGVPAIAAVREFATVGQGTPIPFDPPKTLVTTGIYAYLGNPMQTSLVATLLAWSAYLESHIALSLAIAGFLYAIGFARWSEGSDLKKKNTARFGFPTKCNPAPGFPASSQSVRENPRKSSSISNADPVAKSPGGSRESKLKISGSRVPNCSPVALSKKSHIGTPMEPLSRE